MSTVLLALTLARDEVFWLMKHSNVQTPKGKYKPNPDDYNDPYLPELLFETLRLKGNECTHINQEYNGLTN